MEKVERGRFGIQAVSEKLHTGEQYSFCAFPVGNELANSAFEKNIFCSQLLIGNKNTTMMTDHIVAGNLSVISMSFELPSLQITPYFSQQGWNVLNAIILRRIQCSKVELPEHLADRLYYVERTGVDPHIWNSTHQHLSCFTFLRFLCMFTQILSLFSNHSCFSSTVWKLVPSTPRSYPTSICRIRSIHTCMLKLTHQSKWHRDQSNKMGRLQEFYLHSYHHEWTWLLWRATECCVEQQNEAREFVIFLLLKNQLSFSEKKWYENWCELWIYSWSVVTNWEMCYPRWNIRSTRQRVSPCWLVLEFRYERLRGERVARVIHWTFF